MTVEFRYEKLRWKEIGEAVQNNRVVLIPIACVEDHGPHLPLDVDIAIVTDIAHRTSTSGNSSLAFFNTASPSTPLRQAARRFRERHFGAMPVMDGRDIVGIVSVVDVLAALGESAPGAEPSGGGRRSERGVSGGASAGRTSSAP